MNCTIHTCPQRSPEWHAIRADKLTASDMGPWLTTDKPTKAQRECRQKHICRILAARRGCEAQDPETTYQSWAMEWGIDLEPAARAAFEDMSGYSVSAEIGFLSSREGCFGCSPDGAIVTQYAGMDPLEFDGLEIKVMAPTSHLWEVLYGESSIPDEYRFQVHGSLAVSGAKIWHYWAWNPGLPPIHVLQRRDDFTETLLRALIEFSAEVDAAEARMSAIDAKHAKSAIGVKAETVHEVVTLTYEPTLL